MRHLLGVDLDALGVGLGHPGGGDLQAGRGGCGAEVGQDRLEAVEWPPGPVEADETEQAGFDRVPLAAAAGIMGHRDAQLMRVAAGVLEGVLPGPGAAAVAAAAVGEDQQAGGARVADAAFGAPPGFDAIDGELGGVRGVTDAHVAAIGVQVVDAVGDCAALRLGREVVVAHLGRGLVPGGAGLRNKPTSSFFWVATLITDPPSWAGWARRAAMRLNCRSRSGCWARARHLRLTRHEKRSCLSKRQTVGLHRSLVAHRRPRPLPGRHPPADPRRQRRQPRLPRPGLEARALLEFRLFRVSWITLFLPHAGPFLTHVRWPTGTRSGITTPISLLKQHLRRRCESLPGPDHFFLAVASLRSSVS